MRFFYTLGLYYRTIRHLKLTQLVNRVKKVIFKVKLRNIDDFKHQSDVIVANRVNQEIEDVTVKVFSRDIFGID